MIEKMKMVYIVSSVSRKDEMLEGLRNLGLMHLASRKAPGREATERFENLSRTASFLQEYAPDKKERVKEPYPVLSDQEFEEMYQEVLGAIERKDALNQKITENRSEIDRIKEWGNFSPEEVKELKRAGYDIHFYRLGKNEYKMAAENPDIKMIRLASVDKMDTVAVMGTLPSEIASQEFVLPEKSMEELENEIESSRREIASCEEIFKKAVCYESSFQAQMLKAQNEENYSSAGNTVEGDEELVWISGYIPEDDIQNFKEKAADNGWAWAVDDVAEDDDNIPTKMRFNKVSKLLQPVLDILGILPGYYEADISLWFFLFFTLFFAMIIGDGGYGALILIGTIALHVKSKKGSTAIYLLYVLSIATIAWGAVTGTWFGMEKAMEVPLLRAMVIPNFANYPEIFGVTAQTQQNAIMKFSFSIGAIQMALGSLIAVKRKIAAKDLSFMADLGWVVAIVAMYLLALYLVIGENIPFKPIVTLIAIGFILVIIFGGMEPDKTFVQGLTSGLANIFTVFLDTISCFGNVMSYIRLFAVGMAGLAISQSFNGLASGFADGPLIIVAAVVVIIGHALNIVMCFLSVVVHGVRLNVMEFSGQAGLEWTGIPYEPFKINEKLKK